MLVHPELAGGGIDRGAFGIAMTVGESFGQDGGLTEKWIVLGDRAIGIDASDAAGKIAKNVRVGDFVGGRIHFRIVETETVRAGDVERAIGRENNATVPAVKKNLHVFETLLVVTETRAGDALGTD